MKISDNRQQQKSCWQIQSYN
uniref:Uncharacterized protein n=1 Tax=Tetranychus urticae TaxID=32264 RepID=T1KM64_TETUR